MAYEPVLWGVAGAATATLAGIWPVRKFIQVIEAKTEMQAGSPGKLRALRGWSFIALWGLLTWYAGTVIGDWGASGDLEGALERAVLRARLIIELLALIMAADQ